MRLACITALLCILGVMVAGCSADPHYRGERISLLPWSLPHGTGTYQSPEGWTYTGQWRTGKREGTGTCVYPDGSAYVGQWHDDKPHGEGSHAWPDGRYLEGLWREGEFVGTRRRPGAP